MNKSEEVITKFVNECVFDMGDIFWDHEPDRDEGLQFTDPYVVARRSIRAALRKAVKEIGFKNQYLRSEYSNLVSGLDNREDKKAIVAELVDRGAWTRKGAEEIHRLAKHYGRFVLSNALALAEALDIEDGECGL